MGGKRDELLIIPAFNRQRWKCRYTILKLPGARKIQDIVLCWYWRAPCLANQGTLIPWNCLVGRMAYYSCSGYFLILSGWCEWCDRRCGSLLMLHWLEVGCQSRKSAIWWCGADGPHRESLQGVLRFSSREACENGQLLPGIAKSSVGKTVGYWQDISNHWFLLSVSTDWVTSRWVHTSQIKIDSEQSYQIFYWPLVAKGCAPAQCTVGFMLATASGI